MQLGGEQSNHPTGHSEEELQALIDTLKICDLDIGEQNIENLIKLIRRYANVFARNSQEVGHVRLMKVGIDVQGHPPLRVKPYRVSPTERNVIKAEVEKMLRIESSPSQFQNGISRTCYILFIVV